MTPINRLACPQILPPPAGALEHHEDVTLRCTLHMRNHLLRGRSASAEFEGLVIDACDAIADTQLAGRSCRQARDEIRDDGAVELDTKTALAVALERDREFVVQFIGIVVQFIGVHLLLWQLKILALV